PIKIKRIKVQNRHFRFSHFLFVQARFVSSIAVVDINCDVCADLFSAGTASASLPWQRVCRRCSQRTVLVGPPLKPAPASSSNASQYASSAQGSIEVYSSSTLSAGSSDTCYSRRTRKATAAFASHEENWFVFSRSHHPPLTRTNE